MRTLKLTNYPVILSEYFVSWCLRGYEQKMRNEPNSNPISGRTKNEITHFNNEPRTMNYEQLSNEPNLKNTKINATSVKTITCDHFRPLDQQKNEPNLCKTNPILSTILSIYAIGCSLDGKYLSVLCALGGYKQKMQNEPNFQTRLTRKRFASAKMGMLLELG